MQPQTPLSGGSVFHSEESNLDDVFYDNPAPTSPAIFHPLTGGMLTGGGLPRHPLAAASDWPDDVALNQRLGGGPGVAAFPPDGLLGYDR